MGLSRMQGTSGYISYYGSKEGKRTRHNCDHYERFAQCCFRNKKIQACKSPSRCEYHTENTTRTLIEIRESKKEQQTNKPKNIQQKKKKKSAKKVVVGSLVELFNLDKCTRMFVTIVEPQEMDRAKSKIPKNSLLARNLLGKEVGQKASYHFEGQLKQYKIVSIK